MRRSPSSSEDCPRGYIAADLEIDLDTRKVPANGKDVRWLPQEPRFSRPPLFKR
jgi:hypothetical protein